MYLWYKNFHHWRYDIWSLLHFHHSCYHFLYKHFHHSRCHLCYKHFYYSCTTFAKYKNFTSHVVFATRAYGIVFATCTVHYSRSCLCDGSFHNSYHLCNTMFRHPCHHLAISAFVFHVTYFAARSFVTLVTTLPWQLSLFMLPSLQHELSSPMSPPCNNNFCLSCHLLLQQEASSLISPPCHDNCHHSYWWRWRVTVPKSLDGPSTGIEQHQPASCVFYIWYETKMTVSVLKQNPNTWNVKRNTYLIWLIDWLMIAYIALFSALLSRLTALACDSDWLIEVLLYVHRNRRLIRDGSPGRPPRLSHSSWAM